MKFVHERGTGCEWDGEFSLLCNLKFLQSKPSESVSLIKYDWHFLAIYKTRLWMKAVTYYHCWLLWAAIALYMANNCCSIETEPKTLNEGQLNRARVNYLTFSHLLLNHLLHLSFLCLERVVICITLAIDCMSNSHLECCFIHFILIGRWFVLSWA